MEVSIKKKEAYYTATQMQLVRTRFFGNRSAMIAGSILLFMIVCSLFSGFLSPYDPTIAGRDKNYENGAPHGYGKMTWSSGQTYLGEWRNGEMVD